MTGARLSKGLAGAAWLGLAVLPLVSPPVPACARANSSSPDKAVAAAPGACANLREQIPGKYRERYERWKATLLSADTGRQLWLGYACNPAFRLTIVVSDSMGMGGEVKLEDYRWDGDRLTAATVVLGHRLDRGYPDSLYYPVLNSLSELTAVRDAPKPPDDILAAAKIAHELGHVDQAAKADPARFRLQNELSQVYASHFRANGYDADDPALAAMAARMGGVPAILSGQREYWAETYSLRYLLSKLLPDMRRKLLRMVRKSLTAEPALCLPSPTEWQALTSYD